MCTWVLFHQRPKMYINILLIACQFAHNIRVHYDYMHTKREGECRMTIV